MIPKECFIVRNSNWDGYSQAFTELIGIESLTVEAVEEYYGTLSDMAGSIIYKCIPVYVMGIDIKPTLTKIEQTT